MILSLAFLGKCVTTAVEAAKGYIWGGLGSKDRTSDAKEQRESNVKLAESRQAHEVQQSESRRIHEVTSQLEKMRADLELQRRSQEFAIEQQDREHGNAKDRNVSAAEIEVQKLWTLRMMERWPGRCHAKDWLRLSGPATPRPIILIDDAFQPDKQWTKALGDFNPLSGCLIGDLRKVLKEAGRSDFAHVCQVASGMSEDETIAWMREALADQPALYIYAEAAGDAFRVHGYAQGMTFADSVMDESGRILPRLRAQRHFDLGEFDHTDIAEIQGALGASQPLDLIPHARDLITCWTSATVHVLLDQHTALAHPDAKLPALAPRVMLRGVQRLETAGLSTQSLTPLIEEYARSHLLLCNEIAEDKQRWLKAREPARIEVRDSTPARIAAPAPSFAASIGIDLVPMPGFENGPVTFWQGTVDSDLVASDAEKPRHKVTLTQAYSVMTHPMTQGQYVRLRQHNPSWFSKTGAGKDKVQEFANTDNFPVECVNSFEAMLCANELSKLEGLAPFYTLSAIRYDAEGRVEHADVKVENWKGTGFRLPLEAEWEYAARLILPQGAKPGDRPVPGGSAMYPWGNSISPQNANYDDSKLGRTSPVGSYPPTPGGLYDLMGNVLEWVWDWHDSGYYKQFGGDKVAVDPRGPATASGRVYRGGSYSFGAAGCRSAYRNWFTPSNRYGNLGFRLVRGH